MPDYEGNATNSISNCMCTLLLQQLICVRRVRDINHAWHVVPEKAFAWQIDNKAMIQGMPIAGAIQLNVAF